MKIVEYNHSYAALVADMWNKSSSSWGNEISNSTAEIVIASETTSGNIKLYLAIDKDEVVGYCSFSEYQYDEDASYLPLLNVRPDYLGKKVGKTLILKVIDDAIKSVFPRFDLFTWSGNIKAMPLYKKCGFFWEKKNNSVHLMNFIPYLYKTPALVSYLSEINWYKDSKRVIDMNPDGELRNGFEYYRYDFENDQTKLAFEFEKTSRGLRYIETPDYLIEMSLPKHKLVFNETYQTTLRFVNKSGKPLTVEVTGCNNKNVISDFKDTLKVEDEIIISRDFFVGETKKPQNKMRTYPSVEVELNINGQRAKFKTGLEPKSPIQLDLNITEYHHTINSSYSGYLDVENNLDSETTFTLTMPKTLIDVKNHLEIKLLPNEKKSIKLDYSVLEYGFYNPEIQIEYNDYTINQQVKALVKGFNHSFHALEDERAYLVSGNFVCIYAINNHNIVYFNNMADNPKVAFFMPQLGLPYSLEFSNITPIFTFPSVHQMDVKYISKTFKGIEVIIHIENYFGILKVNYEVLNNGESQTVSLSVPVWQSLQSSYIPYDSKIIRTTNIQDIEMEHLDSKKLDENWIYNYKYNCGFTWDKQENVNVSGWRLNSTRENIVLDTLGTYSSKDFYISYIHSNYQEFRKFTGNHSEKAQSSFLDVVINNGNPFSKSLVDLKFANSNKSITVGTLTYDDKTIDLDSTLSVEPKLTSVVADLKDRQETYTKQLFKVEGTVSTNSKDNILTIDNGVLSYKSSTTYSDSIFSLVFKDKEWLDSNYPLAKERAWWGTFIGGINLRTSGIQDGPVLKENRTEKFVELTDNYGQLWTGIKISVSFEKEEDLKGIIFDSYTMTQPGIPLIYSFSSITNNSGKYISNKNFVRFITTSIDDDKTKVSSDIDGIRYKCGNIGIDKETEKLIVLESSREYNLALYNSENKLGLESQTDYTILFSVKKLSIPYTKSKQLSGDFIFFTKDRLKKEYLKDFDNIKFEV